MPVKVIQGLWDEIFSSPFEGTDDVVARGIRYAADNGAKVINLSIGREDGGPATAVIDAVRYAIGRGCFIAVASGNTRTDGNAFEVVGHDAQCGHVHQQRLLERGPGERHGQPSGLFEGRVGDLG